MPNALVGVKLDVRITDTSVEVMHKGQRVSLHPRHGKGRFVTLTEHMPKAHQAHQNWSPGRFLNWATDIGSATLADAILDRLLHGAHRLNLKGNHCEKRKHKTRKRLTHRDRSEYKTDSSVMAVCKSVTIPGMTGHVRRNTQTS